MHERRFRDAMKVLQVLEGAGFEARLAGGCVRDRLLSLQPKDFDVATTALPRQVAAVFASKDVKVVPTGIDHGTMTVVMPSGPVEVTTLRKDVATDGRRAVVEFGKSFRDDAARRDFTINAMFEDRHGQIFDFFEGRQHLTARRLAFVGEPKARITEDYLRILRLFRFWARFRMQADEPTLQAVAELRQGLLGLSQERITSELKLFFEANPERHILEHWFKTGVAGTLFEDLTKVPDKRILAALATPLPAPRGFLTRLALLLLKAPKQVDRAYVEALATRMRLSNDEGEALVRLIGGYDDLTKIPPGQADVLTFLDRIEGKHADCTALEFYLPGWQLFAEACVDDVREAKSIAFATVEKKFGHLRRAKLPVNGHDVMQELGLAAGKPVQDALRVLRRAFYEEKWRSKGEGLALLRRLQAPPAGN